MNRFDIRSVKQGGRYRGEYRLAHWSGAKAVMDDGGNVILFAHPSDAFMAAATELLSRLNGNARFWAGNSKSECVRQAAEKLFSKECD